MVLSWAMSSRFAALAQAAWVIVALAAPVAGLGPNGRLVRVMPNTPCLVGASASGYAAGESATKEDIAVVDRLLDRF